jgi:hypothetical protein
MHQAEDDACCPFWPIMCRRFKGLSRERRSKYIPYSAPCLLHRIEILSDSIPTITTMSNLASTSLRQASRLCLRPAATPAGLLRSSVTARVAGISSQKISKRGYVSESKRDNAQVNVDAAIRADQKSFFAETGKLPGNQTMPGSTADAMMRPMAGTLLDSEFSASSF